MNLRHPEQSPYRCSLPGLTRFGVVRCTGPEPFINHCSGQQWYDYEGSDVKAKGALLKSLGTVGLRSHELRLGYRFFSSSAWIMEEQDQDRRWMEEALVEARQAAELGEVPVGAVVVRQGGVVGRAFNRRETWKDPLAHAEVLAIRQASIAIGGWRLLGCTMYVTLEPCAMCAGALVNSRMERLVFGARDPKAGFCGSLGDLVGDPRLNHRIRVRRGVLEAGCSKVLKDFFCRLRV